MIARADSVCISRQPPTMRDTTVSVAKVVLPPLASPAALATGQSVL